MKKAQSLKKKNNNFRVVVYLSEHLANLVRLARVQSPLWPSFFDQYVASCHVSVCSLVSSFSPPFRPLAHGEIQYLQGKKGLATYFRKKININDTSLDVSVCVACRSALSIVPNKSHTVFIFLISKPSTFCQFRILRDNISQYITTSFFFS